MEVLHWRTTAAWTPCYRSVVDDASPIGLFEGKASRRTGAHGGRFTAAGGEQHAGDLSPRFRL